MTINIDPCPFCGGEASIVSTFDRDDVQQFYGNCETCDAYGPSGLTESEGVDKWNRRVSDAGEQR
jgi:Lar family restriction alleviation protein